MEPDKFKASVSPNTVIMVAVLCVCVCTCVVSHKVGGWDASDVTADEICVGKQDLWADGKALKQL